MKQDQSLILDRVANGFIVRPSHDFYRPNEYASVGTDVFVFETFPALVIWLDNHYTKPEDKSNG
jgi:hypothetical protein